MRWRLLIVMVCVTAISLAGCSEERVLGPDDDGAAIEAAVGDAVVVELPSNPTTGYSWQVVETAAVEQTEDVEYVADDPDGEQVGSGGTERFVFSRVEDSAGVLVLEYRRPWEGDEVPAQDAWQVTFSPIE